MVLCEPNPRTLNIDPADLERRITHHTVAVLVTHMNGLSADMEAIVGIVARHHHPRRGPIRIVGDAARACGASYRDTKVGAQGWATVFSFQSKKLMTTLGEGGMVTTNDDDLAGRLDRMRSFGHGSDEWGTNYKMTKPQAAVGLVQLRRLDKMNERRRELGLARSSLLCDCPLLLPFEHPDYHHLFYLHALAVPEGQEPGVRDAIVRDLTEHYDIRPALGGSPTYDINAYVRRNTQGQRLPIADSLGQRLFCPPLHPLMTDEDNERISSAIIEVARRRMREPRDRAL